MRISDSQYRMVVESYRKVGRAQRPSEAPGSSSVRRPSDRLDVSDRARELAAEAASLRQALESVPEVREDRVKEVADQINSGQYNVSGEEIADKMIHRSIVDRLI